MKPTAFVHALAPTRSAMRGALSATRPVQVGLWPNRMIDYFHWKRAEYMDDHDVATVAAPGGQNPRNMFWWRRWGALIVGTETRMFMKDNIYAEEQPLKFKHPVPGAHGDRFSHSWNTEPGANHEEKWAKDNWEKRNLTPEQLAAKYGIYIQPTDPYDIIQAKIVHGLWIGALLLFLYHDDEFGIFSHANMDDFIREMNGFDDVTIEDACLEQWAHPFITTTYIAKGNMSVMWRPIVYVCKLKKHFFANHCRY